MSWLFSQALAAEYSEATCSDGEQCALSSGTPMPQAYCAHDKMMAFSRLSRFGMTFAPLTANRGAELLTWFLGGFRAKTSAQQAGVQDLTESDPGSGERWHGWLAKFDQDLSLWRTAQLSLAEGEPELLETLPRSGMTRNGMLWERHTLVLRISETESGLWPTPTTQDNAQVRKTGAAENKKKRGTTLGGAVRMYPTPQASDNRNRGNADTPAIARRIAAGKQVMLTMTVSGTQLNPTWVEWLMGWPLGWTDLKPLEMDKFLQWQRLHLNCCLEE